MFIESGYDLHVLVHAFFLEPGPEPDERVLPSALGGIGPLVLVVLGDRLDCRRVVEVTTAFRDDFDVVNRRIRMIVRENEGRYVALAHLGDGRGTEQDPDAQRWSASLSRLTVDLSEEGVLVLRHVMYDDGIFIDGWHAFRSYVDPVPEMTLTRSPELDAEFTRAVSAQRSRALAALSGLSAGQARRSLAYTPSPPASNEGVVLTMELGEERFREQTWKVAPLSQFLRLNDLKSYGNKADLIERVAALLAGRDTSAWVDGRRRRAVADPAVADPAVETEPPSS